MWCSITVSKYIVSWLKIYMFVVVNFDALAQASDLKGDKVVFLCWMQDSNPGLWNQISSRLNAGSQIAFHGIRILHSRELFSIHCTQIQMQALARKSELNGSGYQGPLLLALPTWISTYVPTNVWDEIIYPFPNFNRATGEVWEWISNFLPYFIMDVIILPCWD